MLRQVDRQPAAQRRAVRRQPPRSAPASTGRDATCCSKSPTRAARSAKRRRRRLFSRFYRGRSARQAEGFGLGLALVREICGCAGRQGGAGRGRALDPLPGDPSRQPSSHRPGGRLVARPATRPRGGRRGACATIRAAPFVKQMRGTCAHNLHRACGSRLPRIQLRQADAARSTSSRRDDERSRARRADLRREPERGRLGRRAVVRSGGHLDHHVHRHPGLSLRAARARRRASRWSWAGRMSPSWPKRPWTSATTSSATRAKRPSSSWSTICRAGVRSRTSWV